MTVDYKQEPHKTWLENQVKDLTDKMFAVPALVSEAGEIEAFEKFAQSILAAKKEYEKELK